MRTANKNDGQSHLSPKRQAVMLAMEQIQKQFGKGSIMRLGDTSHVPVEVIKTGVLPLDIALGVGGIQKGRIVEIFGPEAERKTTVCLSCPFRSEYLYNSSFWN